MKDSPAAQQSGFQLSADSRKLLIRLAPLRQIEETLSKVVSGGSETASESNQTSRQRLYNSSRGPEEVSVPSGSAWKKAILGRRSRDASANSSPETAELSQARRVLTACADDIVKLWKDRTVRQALETAEIALEDQPGLYVFAHTFTCQVVEPDLLRYSFLDDVSRVTAEKYRPTAGEFFPCLIVCPTDTLLTPFVPWLAADVLKARVTTVGPEEHVIRDEKDPDAKEWTIYDVGGSRSQRGMICV